MRSPMRVPNLLALSAPHVIQRSTFCSCALLEVDEGDQPRYLVLIFTYFHARASFSRSIQSHHAALARRLEAGRGHHQSFPQCAEAAG